MQRYGSRAYSRRHSLHCGCGGVVTFWQTHSAAPAPSSTTNPGCCGLAEYSGGEAGANCTCVLLTATTTLEARARCRIDWNLHLRLISAQSERACASRPLGRSTMPELAAAMSLGRQTRRATYRPQSQKNCHKNSGIRICIAFRFVTALSPCRDCCATAEHRRVAGAARMNRPQDPRKEAAMYSSSPFTSPGSRTVVIVGAGFCGTVVAINLLRLAGGQPLRIVLLDRAAVGRGIAYARRDFPYLLNVPAGRMSASSLDSEDFLNFARRSRPLAGASDFLPRELYGDYLEWALSAAERSAPTHVQLHRLRGSATALEREARGAQLQLLLSDGRRIVADAVVLALGNLPPA